jgi:fructokinase
VIEVTEVTDAVDVTALGEVLIDFTPAGHSKKGNVLFERNPGGAPANVLAALAKLGRSTSFIGKVGSDQFGYFLRSVLESSGVDTTGLVFTEETNTTLAFVHLDDHGDRSFSFYRNPGADMLLHSDEVRLQLVANSRVFHFGSISMTHEPSASATLKAVRFARDKGLLISYDPNLRKPLWDSLTYAKTVITDSLKYADILKISEEELKFITGTDDLEQGSNMLYETFDIALIFITLGANGCFFRRNRDIGRVAGYKVKAVDTTGAGDAFLGGMLHQLLTMNKPLTEFTPEELERMVRFSNAVGALVTTKIGAIPAMPSIEEVADFMRKHLN